MLAYAGAQGLFTSVSVSQGLLRLDGQLADCLVRANARGASLPAALQASIATLKAFANSLPGAQTSSHAGSLCLE
jgi:hypothetical protein